MTKIKKLKTKGDSIYFQKRKFYIYSIETIYKKVENENGISYSVKKIIYGSMSKNKTKKKFYYVFKQEKRKNKNRH